MPGFDGTGPQGKGPMTGRGMGFCVLKVLNDQPGQVEGFAGIQGTPVGRYGHEPFFAAARAMYVRGLGRGFGCGRGFRGVSGRLGW